MRLTSFEIPSVRSRLSPLRFYSSVSEARRVSLFLMLWVGVLAGVPRLSTAELQLSSPGSGECPASIEDIDMESFLDERDGVEPEDCLGPVSEPPTVELKYVEYGELDGEPGLEVVVRAQTCVMGSGGSDISEVLRLRCAASGGWSLERIPVEAIPYGIDPGRPRYSAYLEVNGSRLESSQFLYRPGDISVDPSWERTTIYEFKDGRFRIESMTVRELGKRP